MRQHAHAGTYSKKAHEMLFPISKHHLIVVNMILLMMDFDHTIVDGNTDTKILDVVDISSLTATYRFKNFRQLLMY